MYLDVYEMTNQKLEQKERMKDKISFTCKECGPGIPVYVEIWEQNSDSPIGMYFLDQNIGCAKIVDELILKEVEEPKNINHIHYCGECDKILKKPITIEHQETIIEYVKTIIIEKGYVN